MNKTQTHILDLVMAFGFKCKGYLVLVTLSICLLCSNSVVYGQLTDAQLIDAINSGSSNSGQLMNLLLNNSPLSDAVLIAMLNRTPPMRPGHIETVLLANSPLSDAVLLAMLQMSPRLPNGNLSVILNNESPLSTDVLAAVGALARPLPPGILNNIVANNPLNGTIQESNISCNGSGDGSIDLTMAGGIPPYSFLWSTGATTEDISGLSIGVFSVTITDTQGGNITENATITEPALLIVSETHMDESYAGLSDGDIVLSVSGGVTPYAFIWSTTETTQTITGLSPGNYDVTVTDQNVCVSTLQISIGTLSLSEAVTFNNHNVVVRLNSGVFLKARANIINTGTGLYDNSGGIHLTGDLVSAGGNNLFNAQPGTVQLFGQEDQAIIGAQLIVFNNLSLSGSGLKTLEQEVDVEGVLSLEDRELDLNSNIITVSNQDAGAIQRTTGFIITDGNVGLIRTMNTTSTYLFPVGSNNGSPKYRPVDITPTSTVPQKYFVQMIDKDPTVDGFSVLIKEPGLTDVNASFYHVIDRLAGTDPVDVSIFFDVQSDGSFSGIAQWKGAPQWEALSPTNAEFNVPPVLSFVSISNLSDFIPPAIALTRSIDQLIVNTLGLSQIDYVVTGANLSGTFQTGTIEIFTPLRPNPGTVETIVLDMVPIGNSVPIDLLFDIDNGLSVSNVKIIIDPSPIDDLSTDNYSISPAGNTISFFNEAPVEAPPTITLILRDGLLLTPNAAQFNQFIIDGLNQFATWELSIFDLSQTQLFNTTNLVNDIWDGKISGNVVPGTYAFTLTVDGSILEGEFLISDET